MDAVEKSNVVAVTSELSDRTSIHHNITSSTSDNACDNWKYELNFENVKIDEIHMPLQLRGKQWTIERAIGEGTNFKTYLATSNDGAKAMMVKDLQCEKIANKIEDLEMMKQIGKHANIATLIGFRQVNLCWEQFMEYVDGGSLYEYLNQNYIKENRLLEIKKAQSFFHDLLSAVEHIHSLQIAHMDIKLENCLITRSGVVKLTDFDEARYFIPNLKVPYPVYFTVSYAAPETFTRRYWPNCADIWACGIFLYFLLQQNFPWHIANRKDDAYRRWSKMNDKNVFSIIPDCYGCVPDLLMKILNVKAEQRATINEILTHEWLQNDHQMAIQS
uniref:Protein kinase domain-containing protein n=1 Tax=Setaria digitata TaxID=48799 RepID=A0A915PZF6_9BILA